MSPGIEELIARVHGLSAHLLGRARLVEVARSRSLVRVVAELEAAFGSSLGVAAGVTPEQAELAVRRAAAAHLATLARWGPPRSGLLTPFFLDEDRRSVRNLLRGAVAGAAEQERLSGLVPTPLLPERALRLLASQHSVTGIAALLSAWNHPFGSRLVAMSADPGPDLLRLDLLLNDTWITASADAVRSAPRGFETRRELTRFVRDSADAANAMTALQVAGQSINIPLEELFLAAGHQLTRDMFVQASSAPSAEAARMILERAFRSTELARAFTASTRDTEEGFLVARMLRSIRNAWRAPLGAAPVVAFVFRLRMEVRDLCLIIWRLAAGAAPPAPREILSVT